MAAVAAIPGPLHGWKWGDNECARGAWKKIFHFIVLPDFQVCDHSSVCRFPWVQEKYMFVLCSDSLPCWCYQHVGCGVFWNKACDYLPHIDSFLAQSSCWAVIPMAAALVADSAVADLFTFSDHAILFQFLFQFLGSTLVVAIDAEIGCGHPLYCSWIGLSPCKFRFSFLNLFEEGTKNHVDSRGCQCTVDCKCGLETGRS